MSATTIEIWTLDQAALLVELFNEHLAMLPYDGRVTDSQLLRFSSRQGRRFRSRSCWCVWWTASLWLSPKPPLAKAAANSTSLWANGSDC